MPENPLLNLLSVLTVSAGVSAIAADPAMAATSPEERAAYESASKLNTIEALQDFLILFPDSDLAPVMFDKLNALVAPPTPPDNIANNSNPTLFGQGTAAAIY